MTAAGPDGVVQRIARILESPGSPLCDSSCDDPEHPPTVYGKKLAHHCDCSAVRAAALLLGSFKLTDHYRYCGTGEWWDEIYGDEIAAAAEFLKLEKR